MIALPPAEVIQRNVQEALAEDLGTGDRTADLIPNVGISAGIVSRQAAVIAGTAWVDEVFRALDTQVRIHWQCRDGDRVGADETLCALSGPARSVLAGERVALNFLQTLSGTATLTAEYASRIAGTAAVLLDTRKTIPGLRRAQKYAVTCGGGQNHRLGLYDAILIKENHISAAGSIAAALARAQDTNPDRLPVEIEVENLAQLGQALDAGATRILLDNFSLADLAAGVRIANGRARLEASGGINLENIRAVADTGVDCISVGALTKSLQAVDLSLRINGLRP